MSSKKYIYFFANGKADGRADMKELLGGKGANLAEMTNLGLPVPPGFTISTEVCTRFYREGLKLPDDVWEEVKNYMKRLEEVTGKQFGGVDNPLLVSVRSGAAVSMPGMMETILNLGLNDETVKGLEKLTSNPRFAYDAYRRFIMMFSGVVMDLERKYFEELLDEEKKKYNVKADAEVPAEGMKELAEKYKKLYRDLVPKTIERLRTEIEELRKSDDPDRDLKIQNRELKIKKLQTYSEFPQDVWTQLRLAIGAVFESWNVDKAITYRKINKLPEDMGTAVNVVTMVFGNMGDDSGTGVAFTRDPNTGEKIFYGEYLPNAQGEDVVAGVRTPHALNEESKQEANKDLPTLEEMMPEVYEELLKVRDILEKHYRDMQDIEFTIEKKKLYLLQTRTGKRTARAAVKIAVDMVKEGLITEEEAVLRVTPEQVDQLLHPIIDPKAKLDVIGRGLGASPGAAVGRAVFSADDAVEWARKKGEKVILVRTETSPEDIHGMAVAQGILTSRGGMTSHAAVVARGMGVPAVVGAEELVVDEEAKKFVATKTNVEVREGDWITIDGSTGKIILGKAPLIEPEISGDFGQLMEWADKFRRLRVRTNAETPRDAKVARQFGAEGIGLARTEHMFFAPDRISAMRQMILAESEEERRKALDKLLPMQKEDFKEIFRIMDGLPVTVRLLDPPLHEFLPKTEEEMEELAREIGVPAEKVKERAAQLHEFNPMLGFRGVRLGVVYPEIFEMQVRAIIEAACEVADEGVKVYPEIMIPLVGFVNEMKLMRELVVSTAEKVLEEKNKKGAIEYKVGTMIEVPRAAVTADQIAQYAEFFSFGTNDLTQMTLGFSRDDAGKFIPNYINAGIFKEDPFKTIDVEGVGQLMRWAVDKGRSVRKNLKCGICGEHGGDPATIHFCHEIGLDYVSASPFRVPGARLAAAQAAIKEKRGG